MKNLNPQVHVSGLYRLWTVIVQVGTWKVCKKRESVGDSETWKVQFVVKLSFD